MGLLVSWLYALPAPFMCATDGMNISHGSDNSMSTALAALCHQSCRAPDPCYNDAIERPITSRFQCCMNSPRLALLSPQIPFPPLSGGTTHILHVIQQLARYYQVDLYALAAEPDSADWGPLALCCARMQAFRPSPAPRMSFPLPAVRQEYSAGLVHALRQAWVRQAPAIVQLEFTTMARYASL